MNDKIEMLNRFMKLEKVNGLRLSDITGEEERIEIDCEQATFYQIYEKFEKQPDFKIFQNKDKSCWICEVKK